MDAGGSVWVNPSNAALAAAADATTNPTVALVGEIPHVYNGSTWDRLRGSVAADGAATTGQATVHKTLYNNSTFDRTRSIINATNSTGTGIQAVGLVAQLDDTSLTTITENQFGNLRMSARHALLEAADVLEIDLTATSPSSATTTAQTAITTVGPYRSMFIYASIQGATGGTLDIYLQVTPDSGTTWVDYAHFPQIAAGAAAIKRVWAVTKQAQQTTLATVGTGTTPALAANTIVGGEWGSQIRVVFVAGAGTSAGASQTIKCVLSS
jgi:hypothetical protein